MSAEAVLELYWNPNSIAFQTEYQGYQIVKDPTEPLNRVQLVCQSQLQSDWEHRATYLTPDDPAFRGNHYDRQLAVIFENSSRAGLTTRQALEDLKGRLSDPNQKAIASSRFFWELPGINPEINTALSGTPYYTHNSGVGFNRFVHVSPGKFYEGYQLGTLVFNVKLVDSRRLLEIQKGHLQAMEHQVIEARARVALLEQIAARTGQL